MLSIQSGLYIENLIFNISPLGHINFFAYNYG